VVSFCKILSDDAVILCGKAVRALHWQYNRECAMAGGSTLLLIGPSGVSVDFACIRLLRIGSGITRDSSGGMLYCQAKLGL